jgi:hypothetical protein
VKTKPSFLTCGWPCPIWMVAMCVFDRVTIKNREFLSVIENYKNVSWADRYFFAPTPWWLSTICAITQLHWPRDISDASRLSEISLDLNKNYRRTPCSPLTDPIKELFCQQFDPSLLSRANWILSLSTLFTDKANLWWTDDSIKWMQKIY